MDHSKSLRTPIVKAVAMIFAVVALLLGSVLVSTMNASAGTGPLIVHGYVYDNMGNPLEGANVVITIVDTSASRSTTTDENGFYSNAFDAFAMEEWYVDDTVQVVATYNGFEAMNSTTLPDTSSIQVDVHYLTEIPEFGSFAGVAIASIAIGAVAMLSMRKRRA